MFNGEVKSILDLLKAFPDEQTCIDHFEKIRWNGNVVSPFDPTSKVYKCKNNRYFCKNTNKYFNVKTDTLFDNTKMPLQTWFLAIFLITSHKKGISSLQLGRDLNITQKSAWFMLQRIRACFNIEDGEQLQKEVEIDETYIGGKEKNRHEKHNYDYHIQKTIVFGAVERGGAAYAKIVPGTSVKILQNEVLKVVATDAKLYSDQHSSYRSLNRVYDHTFVKHNKGQYVNGLTHTNTIEGFWSLLKRGIYGIYHFASFKHLQKYVDEFVFRDNTRHISTAQRMDLLLLNMETRTTYKKLVNG
jgi:hypothetical protein